MQAAHPHCAMCRSVTAKGTPGESEPQTVWARASKQCQQQATRSADLVFLCSGLRPDTNTDTDTDTDTECCRCATTLQDVCAMRGHAGGGAETGLVRARHCRAKSSTYIAQICVSPDTSNEAVAALRQQQRRDSNGVEAAAASRQQQPRQHWPSRGVRKYSSKCTRIEFRDRQINCPRRPPPGRVSGQTDRQTDRQIQLIWGRS